MPLLYGEGLEKAFFRLQKEFIQDSDDESIFLWDRPARFFPRDDDNDIIDEYRLLAPDPCLFERAAASSLRICEREKEYVPRPRYTLTHKGLQFEARALKVVALWAKDSKGGSPR
jgi:hypothetical protein